ncbi:hypothetical protein H4S02_001644 [Coemansia sp. RSA 2611]|nr:hypothetical protein IWW52_000638 [Coemansia sp. RSA 2704]KAJ2368455.1 hypothetical protein H4S01_001587 [Coemansia sp. RSA 2610]KAJ2390823.1 hypothetical protein H4S02_001644 [Coemansia sp. RSA 2611]KAJ2735441.1 hypothetical protein H4R23_002194 [Coemansia sp. Cherry 401B]
MLFRALIPLSMLLAVASAHTILTNIITDKNYGYGKCIRPYWKNPNYPVNDVTSPDLTCRSSDMDPAHTDYCPVAAGSNMTVEWHRNKKMDPNDVISASHYGSCVVYMAPMVPKGGTPKFFKIFESGYDTSTKQWCTTKLIANKGKLDIKIPSKLLAGKYLMRTELIALHGARVEGQTQFFPNCVQLEVTGGGKSVPDGVTFPGYYKSTDPGILYKGGKNGQNYVIPGPAVEFAGK